MIIFDWHVNVADLIIAAIGAIGVYILRPVVKLLVEMRDTLHDIAPKVAKLEETVEKHNSWLTEMRVTLGFKNRPTTPQS